MTNPSFGHLGLSDEMTQALAHINYTEPTPIQYQAIPVLMEGKDIIGQAQTGTGKTAAFAIPIIEKIIIEKRQIQAIVICPTRELAIQVADEFRKFSKFKEGLTIVSVYGGQPMERQRMALHKRPQILIATPGRLLDFLRRGAFHLNSVQTVVLDEADEMLNMGFRDDIESIFEYIPTPRQTVLFSATMPDPILRLTRQYQTDPERISIVPDKSEQVLIQQFFMMVNQIPKPKMLTQLIDEKQLKSSIVFCNTKRQVDFLVDHLHLEGYPVEGLHGGKTQGQRERILGRFRKGFVKVLVATDVAARGIDVRNIQAVVNYDLPEDAENYTHRIGRTGRAGQEGYAFCIVARNQARLFNFIQKEQRNTIQQYVLEGDIAPQPEQFNSFGGDAPRRKPYGNNRGSNNSRHQNAGPRPFNKPRYAENKDGSNPAGAGRPAAARPESRPAKPRYTDNNDSRPARPVNRSEEARPFKPRSSDAGAPRDPQNNRDTRDKKWASSPSRSSENASRENRKYSGEKPFSPKPQNKSASAGTNTGAKPKRFGKPKDAPLSEPRPFRQKKSNKPLFNKTSGDAKLGVKNNTAKRAKPKVKTTTV